MIKKNLWCRGWGWPWILALGLATAGAAYGAGQPGKPEPSRAFVQANATNAFVFGYAADGMMQRMSAEVLDPVTRKAPFNAYYHYENLATPQVAPFRAPNNDTLYSTAWLDLRKEPAILSVPATHGRYYTAHVMDLHSETIANIGQRVYGTDAGQFAIVGPGWAGELPAGIKAVVRSETVFAAVLLRVYVSGPQDVPEVRGLQKRFSIDSLSRSQTGGSALQPAASADLPPYRPQNSSDRFAMLNWILQNNPPRKGEEALMSQFSGIGLGSAEVVQRLVVSPDVMDEAYAGAVSAIKAAGLQSGRMVNGWRIQLQGIGNYGFDYLQRASVWDGGPLANAPEESVYPSAVTDSQGQMLDGSHGVYTIRFDKERIPPVNSFWSLTIYRLQDGMLVENPISRYSIGDRTPGLKYGADGSLTICLKHAKPCNTRDSNWLPAPDGQFYLALRLYGPKDAARSGVWAPPPIQKQ